MSEFVHGFILGSIAYLVLSLRYYGEFSRKWKIILTVFIAFFCIMMLQSAQWSRGALLRTTGCASAFVIIGIIHYFIKVRKEPNTIILQCPKCLEVQPKSEVCLKCGRDLKEYNASESLQISDSRGAGTNDDAERMDPGVAKFMNKSAQIYLLTALAISVFDIGNLEISKFYCEVVKSLVPSLHGTSVISKDLNNTCLILALSWTWPIVTAVLMIKWLLEQLVNGSVTHILPQGKLFAQLLAFLLVMVIVAGLYYAPFSTPGYGKYRIIFMLMSNWAIASALWGVGIYYVIIIMLIALISFVLELSDKIRG